MKTKFLAFGLIALFTLTSLAQSKQKTTNTSYNSSVSISDSNESYEFKAHFSESRTDNVKEKLLAKLSNKDLDINWNTHLWIKNIDGDEVFRCKLTKGRVKISLDKDEVSTSFYNKISALGNELKTLISGSSSKKNYTDAVKRAKRELKKAERNLDRAKRKLERAKSKVN